MAERERLYYLDNLKIFLIILVVIHHVGQAYGSTGGSWFYSYPGERVKALEHFFRFNASFFMGLFFFISGYFFPGSFDRHGPRKFIADKLIRFGIPLIFALVLMIPIMEYVKYITYVNHINFKDFYMQEWFGYAPDKTVHSPLANFAHLWYMEHLLVYSFLYAIIGTVLQKCMSSKPAFTVRQVRLYAVIPYIIILGIITNKMRTVWAFPMDRWIAFLGFIQLEPAHIPQYMSLFILGILAYRVSFLDSITTPRNMFWFLPGLGIYVFTIAQLFGPNSQNAFFMWEYREAILYVGVCIGLLSFFKTYFNRIGRIMQVLSENTYGTYILHVPVVVALQYAFDPVRAGAFTLFVIVSILSIPGAFLASFFVRLIPGVKRIL
jgi:glucan biosynthesis protein C